MIPYSRQEISNTDIEAVVDVLRSDFLTQGPVTPRFENAIAEKVGAQYSVAVNSATSALHIACRALGLGPGDWMWTSPISFVASANSGLYCGAKVDFVDIDPKTYNICTARLEEKLIEARKSAKLPKIVIPVHLCGQPCDMNKIHELSRIYGFRVIEDASHALGARYKKSPIGNCKYSDVTIFSFHPVKMITTTEGGMAVTNFSHLAEKMSLLRSHGITRDSEKMSHKPDGPWYYQQIELGYNYRMSDIQAALGCSQLKRLDEFVNKRRDLAKRYDEAFSILPITLPWQHIDSYSSYHLYVIRLHQNKGTDYGKIFSNLREQGIGVNTHYIPIHTQPYYKNFGFKKGDYPEAENYYSEAISYPE